MQNKSNVIHGTFRPTDSDKMSAAQQAATVDLTKQIFAVIGNEISDEDFQTVTSALAFCLCGVIAKTMQLSPQGAVEFCVQHLGNYGQKLNGVNWK